MKLLATVQRSRVSPGPKSGVDNRRSQVGRKVREEGLLTIIGGIWEMKVVGNSHKSVDGHFGINEGKQQPSCPTDPSYSP